MLFSVVAWAITGSMLTLVFAALGPVLAVAALADGALARRRDARRSQTEAFAAVDRLEHRIRTRSQADCERIATLPVLRPDGELVEARLWSAEHEPILVQLGVGSLPSRIELDRGDGAPSTAFEEVERALRARIERLAHAPVVIDLTGGLAVTGPRLAAEAAARWAVLGALAHLPLASSIEYPSGEGWVTRLPHRSRPGRHWCISAPDRREIRVLTAAAGSSGTPGIATVLALLPEPELRCDGLAPVQLSPALVDVERALALAERLRNASAERAGSSLPERVDLDELLGRSRVELGGLRTPIGHDGAAPVELDLVADGPHVLVAGMTGAGKSAALETLVLGLAARYSSDEVCFALLDFKGGAAFTRLAGLAQVAGLVTDLDGDDVARAVAGLAAELRAREQCLRGHGASAIEQLPAGVLPRLVVVVDEFAVLTAQDGDAHEVFADLAARGRSLGIHLVLGTQRPAAVMRDGILANAGLRLSLRVNNRADSVALIGSQRAAELPVGVPGRAVLVAGDESARSVQVAIAGDECVRRLAAQEGRRARAVWAPALPALLSHGELPTGAVGLVERREQQRLEVISYSPAVDGGVLVVGGRGSGKTTALGAVAAASGCAVVAADRDTAELWSLLRAIEQDALSQGPLLLLVDDLDLHLADDPERRAALLQALAAAGRRLSQDGGAVLASASRGQSALGPLQSCLDRTVLLGLPSRDDHIFAGGDGRGWRPVRRPGSGLWAGRELQIVHAAPVTPSLVALDRIRLARAGRTVLVCRDPDQLAERLRAAGLAAQALEPALMAGSGEPRLDRADGVTVDAIFLATPERLAEHWDLVEAAVATGRLLMLDDDPVALARLVPRCAPPPPLGRRAGEACLVEGARARRVVIDELE